MVISNHIAGDRHAFGSPHFVFLPSNLGIAGIFVLGIALDHRVFVEVDAFCHFAFCQMGSTFGEKNARSNKRVLEKLEELVSIEEKTGVKIRGEQSEEGSFLSNESKRTETQDPALFLCDPFMLYLDWLYLVHAERSIGPEEG